MAKEILMTQEGYDALNAEYEELVAVKRSEVAEKISAAREQGDLSENAEYDAAREEQAQVEGRIREIEEQLKFVKIISDNEGKRNEVVIGRYVVISSKYDFDNEPELMTYKLVSSNEIDIAKNKISVESPIGNALIYKKKGEKIKVELPNNHTCNIEILDVDTDAAKAAKKQKKYEKTLQK